MGKNRKITASVEMLDSGEVKELAIIFNNNNIEAFIEGEKICEDEELLPLLYKIKQNTIKLIFFYQDFSILFRNKSSTKREHEIKIQTTNGRVKHYFKDCLKSDSFGINILFDLHDSFCDADVVLDGRVLNKRAKFNWRFLNESSGEVYKGFRFIAPTFESDKKKAQMFFSLEIVPNTKDHYERFRNFKSNWLYITRCGCKRVIVNTTPVAIKDCIEFGKYTDLLKRLSTISTSWDANNTHFIVSIDKRLLKKQDDFFKLVYFYHFVLSQEAKRCIFGRYEETSCNISGVTDYAKNISEFSDILLKKKDARKKVIKEMSEMMRYQTGLATSFDGKYIKFQLGRGSLNESRLIAIMRFCLLMIDYIKTTKWNEMNNIQFLTLARNDKYINRIFNR